MVVPFLSLYCGHRFGYTVEQGGYVVGLFGIGSIVGSVVGGRLTDRLGPVRLQIITLLGAALWMGWMAFLDTPAPLIASVFVLGVLNDAFRPGNVAAVAASAPRFRQTKALTLNRSAINAGWAIGPALGGLLAQADYRWLFVADGLTCALAALLLFWFVPVRFGQHKAGAPGAAPAPAHRSPWRDRRFVLLLILSLLAFMTFLQQFQTMTRHLHEVLRFDEADIGALFIINPTVIVILEMPLVLRLKNAPKLAVIAAGALCVGLAYPWLVLQSWGTTAVLASVLTATLGEMLYMPLLGAFVSERAPVHARGNYLGAYFASFSAGFVLAPVLGGLVYDRLGADALWWGCCAVGLLTAAGFWWLHRTDKPPTH
jgi:predicted MFS family arabinose efflux permease